MMIWRTGRIGTGLLGESRKERTRNGIAGRVDYEGLFRWLRQPLENNTQDRNLGPLLHVQME